ncbi:hypothetical protein [Litorivivens sp.]|uniref:hypothetical protein n=1 Tax=Litorivivens sp. TaxID=2020868 RepID=UPI00356298D6
MSASKHFSRSILSISLVAICGTSFAATTDGSKGATSNGKVDVKGTVKEKVQIAGLTEVNLDTALDGWNASESDISETSASFCVWSSTEGYKVKITDNTSASGTTEFDLEATAATGHEDLTLAPLPFSLTWTDESNTAQSVTYNTDLTGLVTTATNKNCTNTTIGVSIAASDLYAARVGNYSAELNITVSPE